MNNNLNTGAKEVRCCVSTCKPKSTKVNRLQLDDLGWLKSRIHLCTSLFITGAKPVHKSLQISDSLPCPLPHQHEFARRVAAVEKLKTAHRAALAEFDALFASLQHRAFQGELSPNLSGADA